MIFYKLLMSSERESSGGLDSNQRPLAPHANALPGCATTRNHHLVFICINDEGCKCKSLFIKFMVIFAKFCRFT